MSPPLPILLDSLLAGAQSELDVLIEAFAPLLPSLRLLATTPQEPEWHGEGDVYRHTSLVLEELYRELDSALGASLSPEARRELILAALLHDLGKPWTTRRTEVGGKERIVSPRHEARGRSAAASALVDIGLPWPSLWRILGLIGSHHEPKLLVVRDKGPGEYKRISRRVDPELVSWLERADLRGRICADRAQQLEILEMFALGMADYAPPGWQERWRQHFARVLVDRTPSQRDRIFGEAIRAAEAGRVHQPEDAEFLIYQEKGAPPELVVLCGPSGSGKSTFLERHLGDHEVISLDTLREELAGDRADQALNGAVRQEGKQRLKNALRPGRKVVWDATCLRKDFRSLVCETGFAYGALVTLVVFQLSPQALAARNKNRQHPVPSAVLQSQLEQWEWPEVDETHRMLVMGADHQVLGAFGFCDGQLPWGLSHV